MSLHTRVSVSYEFTSIYLPLEGLGGTCPGPKIDVMSSPSGAGLSGVTGEGLPTHTHTHTPVSYTHLTLPTSVAV